MQDSNGMDTQQREVGEDGARIMERDVEMKGVEGDQGCVITWVVSGG